MALPIWCTLNTTYFASRALTRSSLSASDDGVFALRKLFRQIAQLAVNGVQRHRGDAHIVLGHSCIEHGQKIGYFLDARLDAVRQERLLTSPGSQRLEGARMGASHAVSQRMVLVTNNLKHFSSVPGLTVEVWS
jgi:predicted nucleic acid-binding protein